MPATAKSVSKSIYSVHPGVAMVQKWVAELPQKTGRSLEQWIELVNEAGPVAEKDRREWLKENYQLGTNSAWWIAERADGKGGEEAGPDSYLIAAEGYVEEMFSGKKSGFQPPYRRFSLGKDVKACPCKTIVPL